jgi:predicted amidohydrolase
MPAPLRLALGQFGPGLGEVGANLARMREMLAEAARAGAALACFPELSVSGYLLEPEDYTGALLDAVEEAGRALAADARQRRIDVVYGAPMRAGGGLVNAVVLQRRDGGRLVYLKTHLVRRERNVFTAGQEFATDPHGIVGLACCYDLAFPEAMRMVALGGARALLVPMAWEVERGFVMRRVVAARAVENLAHVVCVNQAGEIGGMRFQGASCVVDPLGRTVLELGPGEELATVDVDLGLADRLRDRTDERSYPLLRDRRPELYGPLTAPNPVDAGLES